MIAVIMLGFRLFRGSITANTFRLVILGLGVFMAVLGLLTVLALPGVFAAQTNREAARVPVYLSTPRDQWAGAQPVIQVNGSVPGGSALRALVSIRLVSGKPVTRVKIGGAGINSPKPPGLESLPREGEVYLSPALSKLLEKEPGLARDFAGKKIDEIQASGLIQPNELIGYVGVKSLPAEYALLGWGIKARYLPLPRDLLPTLLSLWLLIGLPSLVLLVSSATVVISSRQYGLTKLIQLGLSQRQGFIVYGARVALIAGIAGAVAFFGYPVLELILARTQALGLRWFTLGNTLPGWESILLWAGVVIITFFSAVFGAKRNLRRPRLTCIVPSKTTRKQKVIFSFFSSAGFLALIGIIFSLFRPRLASGWIEGFIAICAVILVTYGLSMLPLLTKLWAEKMSRRLSGQLGRVSLILHLSLRIARFHLGNSYLTLMGIGVMILVGSLSAALLKTGLETKRAIMPEFVSLPAGYRLASPLPGPYSQDWPEFIRALNNHQVHSLLIFGAVFGVILAAFILAISGLDQRLNRYQANQTLRRVGMSVLDIKLINSLQKGLPVLLSVGYFMVISILVGLGIISIKHSLTLDQYLPLLLFATLTTLWVSAKAFWVGWSVTDLKSKKKEANS